MAFFIANMAESLIVLGLILLVIEVMVLGFSTFFLFFLSIGLISSGIIFYIGVIDMTVTNVLISIALISVVSAVILYKPLLAMQNVEHKTTVKNDLIGSRFTLEESLNLRSFINHQYSGINWKVTSDQQLSIGDEVEIIEISVGKMKVRAVKK
jgi:membrane protein implicated in regulation of membrane protease activity